MIIQEKGNLFSFELKSTDDWYGFVPISVKAATQGFSGEIHDTDVQVSDLEIFLSQLRILEETRQGSASLASSDNPEMRLLKMEVYSLDKLGHIGLQLELIMKSHFNTLKVSLGFEIDPGNLPYLVSEFTNLLHSLKKHTS